MRELYHGAEAVVSEDDKTVIKERIKKGYRIKEIDTALRSRRTRLEAKLIREARRAGVFAPQILDEDKFVLKMEFIDGEKIKDILNDNNLETIAMIIGESVARLHSYGIIHGDLTTNNMIMKNDKIYFIDFGLGFFSRRVEDKATDLHLLKEVLESTHFRVAENTWKIILKNYQENYAEGDKVIKALLKIEKRGRYVER